MPPPALSRTGDARRRDGAAARGAVAGRHRAGSRVGSPRGVGQPACDAGPGCRGPRHSPRQCHRGCGVAAGWTPSRRSVFVERIVARGRRGVARRDDRRCSVAVGLRALAAALRDAQEAADDVRVALAEPAGTARLIGWLPLVALALGAGLGFDTFRVLLTTPAGLLCLALGIAMIVAARRWNASLVRRATQGIGIPGLDAELLAIAVNGECRSIARPPSSKRPREPAIGAECQGVLALSRSAGAPAVELLRATASLARHRARVDGRLRASQL